MRKLLLFVFLFFIAGCVTFDTGPKVLVPEKDFTAQMIKPLVSLRQIKAGMTSQEVRSVLGAEVIIGYELVDEATEEYKPLTQKNPYREETRQKDGKEYLLQYYLVGIRLQDGIVADDELVPLVFYKDELVGVGWDYYYKHVKND